MAQTPFTQTDKERLDVLAGVRGNSGARAVRLNELEALAGNVAEAALGKSLADGVVPSPPVVVLAGNDRLLSSNSAWTTLAAVAVSRVQSIPTELYAFLQLRSAAASTPGTLEIGFFRGSTMLQRMTCETQHLGGMIPVAVAWLDGDVSGGRIDYQLRAKKAAPSITGGVDGNVRVSKVLFRVGQEAIRK
jgi:hypothetical protein